MKGHIFLGVLEGILGLHRTIQPHVLQHYWLGHRLALLWYWMISLEMNRDHSAVFEIAHKSFVDYKSYSMSSQAFLPTVIDIMVICIKFNHSGPFCSLIPKMFMFTLSISCLITSNLLLFMVPGSRFYSSFQVPMQYCSLQHVTLLLSPVTSTTGCWFLFGSASSFFLKLFLHWSPVAYWAPTDLGCSSFSVLYFCLFILFMGFSRQEYWSGLPFPSPV